MSINKYLHCRSVSGNSSVGRLSPALDLSFLLKKFKNYSTDEYSTMDADGMSVPPLACSFAKMRQHQHVVGVVDEDGYLVLYNIHKTGRAAVIKTWQVHANAVFDLEWLQEENKILTGSGDQMIALYDIETCGKLETFRGHASSIKSICSRVGDDAVFVSGSRDGHIMMWDKRITHKDGAIPPVNTIYNAHMLQQPSVTPVTKARKKRQSLVIKDAQQSVTAVLFQSENYVISSGAVDGCLKVWDMRKTYKVKTTGAQPMHVFQYAGTNSRKHGYSSLVQDSRGLRLFASCTDDTIYEYDMAAYNPEPVQRWRGHRNSTFYVKAAISHDDQYLMSGSSDDYAYIWQINKPQASPIVLRSHTAEVTSVAWCPNDTTKLVTLSDDTKTKFWRVYCRELSKQSLPQWFGHARRVSKERATSTRNDEQARHTPSSVPLPTSSTPTIPQKSKVLKNPKPSPQLCLKDWLKRKVVENISNDSSEQPSSKVLCKDPHASASLKETTDTENLRKRVHETDSLNVETLCKAPRQELLVTPNGANQFNELVSFTSFHQVTPETAVNSSTSSLGKREERSSSSGPLFSSESDSHNSKCLSEYSDSPSPSSGSPSFVNSPCIKCSKEIKLSMTATRPDSNCETNIELERNNVESDSLSTATKKRGLADSSISSTFSHPQCIPVSPAKSNNLKISSPSKLNKSIAKSDNSENVPYTSPRKTVKRKLSQDELQVASPKRPCLTHIESNLQRASPCSAKVSLFSDTSSSCINNISSHNDSFVKIESRDSGLSKQSSFDDLSMNTESSSSIESVKAQCAVPSDGNSPAVQLNANKMSVSNGNTPVKIIPCSDEFFITPSKELLTADVDWDSPTRNLPNLVMDEMSGLQRASPKLNSGQKQLDWLTHIRLEKIKKSADGLVKQTAVKLSPKIGKGMKKINSYFKSNDGSS